MILFDGTIINNDNISTKERIYLITTYDNDTVICNSNIACQLIKEGKCVFANYLLKSTFVGISKQQILYLGGKE